MRTNPSLRVRGGRFSAPTVLLLAFFLPSAFPAATKARQLHWRELAVDARLDADGSLTVSEQHAMVFTGDWNGGERVFRTSFGQKLDRVELSRWDANSGSWRSMSKGSLDEVDQWDWSESRTLRWRSRRPSDPEFDATEIRYRIDYRLQGILENRGERFWRLDHDFAFPDRDGPIERYVLTLDLAPEWSVPPGFARRVEAGPLVPGESYVVTADLAHGGAAPPANAGPRRLPRETQLAILGVAVLGGLGLLTWGLGRERALGRLRGLGSIAGITREHLEELFSSRRPEEVGAAWDDTVGAAEVAALLARMQLEGKISSRVETKKIAFFKSTVLHLSLLVDRQSLPGAERLLVAGLFPGGGTSTSTEALRRHYKTSGFDPAAKIRKSVEDGVKSWQGFGGTRPRPARWPSVLLILSGLLGLLGWMIAAPTVGLIALPFIGALLATWAVGFGGGFALRNRVIGFGGPLFAIALGQGLAWVALAFAAKMAWMTLWSLGLLVLLYWGLTRSIATALQTRQTAERIAGRRELARARGWLRRELASGEPNLDDTWVPYLIAFGLAPDMDRWFRSHGAATAGVGSSGAGTGSSWGGSGGSGGGSWTGGGGAFGGAGATAAWTTAATAMSAGVASASSSSGGGGGGGGSSGGGGGGGW